MSWPTRRGPKRVDGIRVSTLRPLGPGSPLYISSTYTLFNTGTMAEMSTQDAGGILADDLMRDRARQFVEFLDDDVG